MNMHFVFLTLCLCLAVFTLLEHPVCLCWFSIWKGLVKFPFILLYLFRLDLTGSHLYVPVPTVSITFYIPLGFRGAFGLLSSLLGFSLLLAYLPASVHSLSSLLSPSPYTSPPCLRCAGHYDGHRACWGLWKHLISLFKQSSWVSRLSVGN